MKDSTILFGKKMTIEKTNAPVIEFNQAAKTAFEGLSKTQKLGVLWAYIRTPLKGTTEEKIQSLFTKMQQELTASQNDKSQQTRIEKKYQGMAGAVLRFSEASTKVSGFVEKLAGRIFSKKASDGTHNPTQSSTRVEETAPIAEKTSPPKASPKRLDMIAQVFLKFPECTKKEGVFRIQAKGPEIDELCEKLKTIPEDQIEPFLTDLIQKGADPILLCHALKRLTNETTFPVGRDETLTTQTFTDATPHLGRLLQRIGKEQFETTKMGPKQLYTMLTAHIFYNPTVPQGEKIPTMSESYWKALFPDFAPPPRPQKEIQP